MDTTVVIENPMLRGSENDAELQRVATVYLSGDEYWVMAPSGAIGPAAEWQDQFTIRTPSTDAVEGSEERINPQTAAALVAAVVHELKREEAEAELRPLGKHQHHRNLDS